MFGVIVNGVTAALGAVVGAVVRKGLPKNIQMPSWQSFLFVRSLWAFKKL